MEGISLGYNCSSATYGVNNNIRKTKRDGYKTCPFDMIINNYEGMVQCIDDDFKYFCDTDYLELVHIPETSRWMNTNGDGDYIIYNTKYEFLFNHESPGYDNLFIHERWTGGKPHFINNNYAEFILRYERRIQNFRDYLNSGSHITFILTTKVKDTSSLESVLRKRYPNLQYTLLVLEAEENYHDHMILMKLPKLQSTS